MSELVIRKFVDTMAAAVCGSSPCCSFRNNASPSAIACGKSYPPVFAVKSYADGYILPFCPLATHSFTSSEVNTPRRKPVAFCRRVAQLSCKVETTVEEAPEPDSVSLSSSSAILPPESVPLGIVSLVERESRGSTERQRRKKAERQSYLFAAIASSVGVTFLAAGAVYYRFSWQMQGGAVPLTEVFGTFSLAVGAAVGMEFWARWAHRALWHSSLWNMHESHHRPRDGPFELNDVFAIINAVPAISLLTYGLFHKGLVPGLCFGAGLGITVFGMAYMFVHDGLVHRRFPVGPIANVPYLQKVAAAHQLHHADKFDGVPYGLFLGPKELEGVGGLRELEQLLQTRKRDLSQYSEATHNSG